jgi:transcriptional regulator with PAS, ATPase and Fis domain
MTRSKLEQLLIKKREAVREANRKLREKIEREKAAAKIPKKRGRPATNPKLILEAEMLAYDRPINDVALRLNVSRSTLYARGIKRYILNRKTAA